MPKRVASSPVFLMEIVTLWNAGAIAKWAIAERYNRSVGWLDKRLEEARSIGLEVKVRQVRSGPGLIYSEDILAQITEGLRARQSHPAIAAQIGKNASFVSRAAYILRSRGGRSRPRRLRPILRLPFCHASASSVTRSW